MDLAADENAIRTEGLRQSARSSAPQSEVGGGRSSGGRDTPVAPGRDTGVPPGAGVGPGLLIRRHNLPHWQIGGSVYFVTFRCSRGRLGAACRHIVKEVLLYDHGRRYDLHIATVMPDHAHAVLRPRESSPGRWFDLAQITKTIKGVSGRRINRLLGTRGRRVWRPESYDRIIRDEDEYNEKVNYVAENAFKDNLCRDPLEYEFLIIPG